LPREVYSRSAPGETTPLNRHFPTLPVLSSARVFLPRRRRGDPPRDLVTLRARIVSPAGLVRRTRAAPRRARARMRVCAVRARMRACVRGG